MVRRPDAERTMRAQELLVGVLVLLLASEAGARGQKYSDPDSAEVQAAARAALANAKVVDIVGVTRGIQSLLTDLGAKTTPEEIRIALSADVLFDFDASDLRPEASATLLKVAAVLKEYPTSPVLVEGHTDGKGNDAYNQALSERRAAS